MVDSIQRELTFIVYDRIRISSLHDVPVSERVPVGGGSGGNCRHGVQSSLSDQVWLLCTSVSLTLWSTGSRHIGKICSPVFSMKLATNQKSRIIVFTVTTVVTFSECLVSRRIIIKFRLFFAFSLFWLLKTFLNLKKSTRLDTPDATHLASAASLLPCVITAQPNPKLT